MGLHERYGGLTTDDYVCTVCGEIVNARGTRFHLMGKHPREYADSLDKEPKDWRTLFQTLTDEKPLSAEKEKPVLADDQPPKINAPFNVVESPRKRGRPPKLESKEEQPQVEDLKKTFTEQPTETEEFTCAECKGRIELKQASCERCGTMLNWSGY